MSGPTPKGRGELVLVVEDEDLARTFVSHVLSKSGYDVIGCSNGRDAVRIHQENPTIAIVLTDMHMPDFDGAATARAVRAHNPSVKIVGTSGYPPNHFNVECLDAFLPKPHSAKDLLAILRQVLDA